ncbi:MAG: hypothetical protein M3478_07225 [Planctomycetota bacterium]|nr:hypothetical protein [Planctomycetota bacterium]
MPYSRPRRERRRSGKKEVEFKADRIDVRVTHEGTLGERVPLLERPDDSLTIDGGRPRH